MEISFADCLGEIKSLLNCPGNPLSVPEQINAFESELAREFNVNEAVAVSSGTAAIHCALDALDIGPGDEILVPAISVIMSVVPILYQRACPIFVDSKQECIDFDYNDLEKKISPRTKAVLPVYLWGCSYDLDNLSNFAKKHKLAIIEDACQAHGSRWRGKFLGTWGDIGCFSMKDGKLLSTGEGGFILTNNINLAQKCRAFRTHFFCPQSSSMSYSKIGWNYRLTELQALIGRKKLECLNEILNYRKWQTEYIIHRIANIPQLKPYKYNKHEEPNYLNPILLLQEKFAQRKFAHELSKIGVINSVGTFGLRPVQDWPIFQRKRRTSQCIESKKKLISTPNAVNFLNRVFAPVLFLHYSEMELNNIISSINFVLKKSNIT